MEASSSSPYNVYLAGETTGSLDSFEGVPELTSTPQSDRSRLHYPWQKKLHQHLDDFGELSPGLLLAGAVAVLALIATNWLSKHLLGFVKSPVSPTLMTVLFGLLIRNVVGLPEAFRDGLTWCVKRLLRIGVALLGLRLSLAAIGQIGWEALPVVAGCVAVAIIGVTWLARLTGIGGRMGTLIGVGTSICGVSAIIATGPAIGANDEEVGYSVGVITLFGMLALATYPFLAHHLFAGNETMIGIFLGTSIHDTSQVAGAGLMYQVNYESPRVLEIAATTKLVRNLSLGIVVPLLAYLHSSSDAHRTGFRLSPTKWIPGFVIAFVALALFRTIGDLGDRPFGILNSAQWTDVVAMSQKVSLGCLTLAMAAIGLGTSLGNLRQLGLRPLAIGLSSAVLVGAVSFGLIRIFVG